MHQDSGSIDFPKVMYAILVAFIAVIMLASLFLVWQQAESQRDLIDRIEIELEHHRQEVEGDTNGE